MQLTCSCAFISKNMMVVVLSFSLKRLGKIRSFRQKTEVLKYPSVTHYTNVKCLVTKRDQTSFDDYIILFLVIKWYQTWLNEQGLYNV